MRKFYRTIIRLLLLYGSKLWAFGKDHSRMMGIAELQMLSWISRYTLRDKIQNEDIRKVLEVANIEEKMKDNHLRWFGHVQQYGICELVTKIESWSSRDLKRGEEDQRWLCGGGSGVRASFMCYFLSLSNMKFPKVFILIFNGALMLYSTLLKVWLNIFIC